MTGVDTECINLVDRKTNKILDNRMELVFRKGKLYMRKPGDNNEKTPSYAATNDNFKKPEIYLPEDEIELFFVYKGNQKN